MKSRWLRQDLPALVAANFCLLFAMTGAAEAKTFKFGFGSSEFAAQVATPAEPVVLHSGAPVAAEPTSARPSAAALSSTISPKRISRGVERQS